MSDWLAHGNTATLMDDPIGSQRPVHCSLPFACSHAAGREAVEFAGKSGLVLDDWQAWTLEQSMGTQQDGRWAAKEVGLLVSRQNGKNAILEARELGGLFLLGEKLIIHTAHEFKASSEHFLRIRNLVESRAELFSRVKAIRTSHGDETIELRPSPTLIFGSKGTQIRRSVAPRLRFLARSRGSGRSFTCDCLVWDESMILSEEQVGASMPTLSAVPNPQLWYTASAGYPDSTQLARLRRRGHKGEPGLVWLEWCLEPHDEYCEPGCDEHDDPDDERAWGKANPGLGIRIAIEHIRWEHDAMMPAEFRRERCGIGEWPPDENAWAVIPEADWSACAQVPPYEYPRPRRFAVACDVTPDQSAGAIAVAGFTDDGRLAVEIGANPQGLPDHRAGTAWMIPRLREFRLQYARRANAVVIDKLASSGALLVDAENASLDPVSVSTSEITAAFGFFRQMVMDRKIIHRDQPALRNALAGAMVREIGDGARAWSRKDTSVDISPLCAATLAVWAANKFARPVDLLKTIA